MRGFDHKTLNVRIPEPIYYLVKASAQLNNTSMAVVIAHLLIIGWKDWISTSENGEWADLEELAAREVILET